MTPIAHCLFFRGFFAALVQMDARTLSLENHDHHVRFSRIADALARAQAKGQGFSKASGLSSFLPRSGITGLYPVLDEAILALHRTEVVGLNTACSHLDLGVAPGVLGALWATLGQADQRLLLTLAQRFLDLDGHSPWPSLPESNCHRRAVVDGGVLAHLLAGHLSAG